MQARSDEGEIASFEADRLLVHIFEDRVAAGEAAARGVAEDMRELVRARGSLGMVFASAPSQLELLQALVVTPDLPWNRVAAFHLDEYVGIGSDEPRSFVRFLREHLFERVEMAETHLLNGVASSAAEECQRYQALLRSHRLDIACIGIGENGHIAFNEPGETDFDDPRLVRLVELDQASRRQQVNEGLFGSLDEVPTEAMTLTVPAITSVKRIHCIVPGRNKARAVERTVEGEMSTACPASVLRAHPGAVLYLDRESASLLSGRAS
ncbi:MAG TPA: glucosamine-6-phosphate deaminase [Trueperaceae bacterium]